jgi:hypothetical protein
MNRFQATLATALLMLPLSLQAQELRLTASVMPSYYSGTYGTNTRTDIFYVPLDMQAKTGNWTLKLTVPYIRVHSHGAIIAGGAVVGTTNGAATTHSGLGDIWLQGRYKIHLDDRGDSISPYLKYKFGTASRTQGLGTGANDYEYGGILHLRAGAHLFPFAQLGYRVHGQAPGYTLNDTLTYQAGASYFVNPANIATLMYAGHSASQPRLQAASMAIGAWNYRSGEHTELQAYGLLGFSTGSPDYGGGLSYMYHF